MSATNGNVAPAQEADVPLVEPSRPVPPALVVSFGQRPSDLRRN